MFYTLRYTLRKSALHILRACGTRNMVASEEVTQLLRKCKKIVTAMDVLDEEMTMDNFNLHFYGEEVMQKKEEELRVGQVRPRDLGRDKLKNASILRKYGSIVW